MKLANFAMILSVSFVAWVFLCYMPASIGVSYAKGALIAFVSLYFLFDNLDRSTKQK